MRLAILLCLLLVPTLVQAQVCYGPYCQQPVYQQPVYVQPAPQPQQNTKSDSPSDVTIRVTTAQGNDLGSGTVVRTGRNECYVLTNYHVVSDAAGPIEVANYTARYTGVVVATDTTNDLALLRVYMPLPAVQIATELPRRIIIRSFDGGRRFMRRVGEILGTCTTHQGYYVNVPVLSGSSGGGVYNEQGQLCGVVWGCNGETFCVGLQPIMAIMQQIPDATPTPEVPPQPQPPEQPPATTPEPDRRIVDLTQRVDTLEARVDTLEQVAGQPGPQGPAGPQGPPGPAGVSTAAESKPFYIRTYNKKTGTYSDYAAVTDGSKVTIIFSPDE